MSENLYKKDAETKYFENIGQYKKLGANLKQAIEIFLEDFSINYMSVYFRIKKSDSFLKKIDRKKYTNPFEQIEDICGVRVICYYRSDIQKICDIINREFDVLESQDKEALLKPDQFGYRSHHFIVKIKNEWLNTPNYKGLGELKAEIQVRTILMHTWAEIEHELGYKKEEDIPVQFKRKFSRISAKLEEADEQFEELKIDINEYRNQVAEQSKQELAISNDELNLDNLHAKLDYLFPERDGDSNSISELLTELKKFNIDMSLLTVMYEKSKRILPELEEEERNIYGDFRWEKSGIVRAILMLNIQEYRIYINPPQEVVELCERYQIKLENRD